MHLVLTGAAGLVGRHTLYYLLEQGHKVTAIDIVKIGDELLEPVPAASRARLETVVMDLVDYKPFQELLDKVDVDGVIHLGGIPNPMTLDPRVVYNTNVTSNYNVLRTAAERGINRVVLASSVNIHGLSFTPWGHHWFESLPLDETSPVRPEDPYATSKLSCEGQADALTRLFPDLRVASLRFHMCKTDYKEASEFGRGLSLWGWVSYDACARACLQGITSEGWKGHEAFALVADEICWEGGVQPEQRFNGEHLGSLDLLRGYWKGHYGKVDQTWWDKNPRRGFWNTAKAEKLLGWKH